MIILILIVVSTVFTVKAFDLDSIGEGLFVTALAAAFYTFLYTLCLIIPLGKILPQHPVIDRVVEISALNDATGVEGESFLFSGYIQTTPYYFFMEKYGEAKKMGQVAAVNAFVYEDGKTQVKYYRSEFDKEWYGLLSAPGKKYSVDIHIPEDSITDSFDIDLR
jgi:hypothetical protein